MSLLVSTLSLTQFVELFNPLVVMWEEFNYHLKIMEFCKDGKEILQMLEQFVLKKNEKKAHSLPFMFRDFDQFHPKILSAVESEIKRLVSQNRPVPLYINFCFVRKFV